MTIDEFKKTVDDFEAAVNAQVEKYSAYESTQAALKAAGTASETATADYNAAKAAATAARDAMFQAASELL